MKRIATIGSVCISAICGCRTQFPALPLPHTLANHEVCTAEARVYTGRYVVDFESSILETTGTREFLAVYGDITSIWEKQAVGPVKPACFDVSVESSCYVPSDDQRSPPWPWIRVSRVLQSKPVEVEYKSCFTR
jgi:hypothetical protein